MSHVGQFQLTNVLGTMWSSGNLVFTPDGFSLIVVIGNKITIYDLKNHRSRSLCFDSSHNYVLLEISPNGKLLIALNEVGLAHCISLSTYSLLHSKRFGDGTTTLRFSSDGRYIAVGKYKEVIIYTAPSELNVGSALFEMKKVFKNLAGEVNTIEWSFDSKLVLITCKDSAMTFVCPMEKLEDFSMSSFSMKLSPVVAAFFDYMEYHFYTVTADGMYAKWECTREPEDWKIQEELSLSAADTKRLKTAHQAQKIDKCPFSRSFVRGVAAPDLSKLRVSCAGMDYYRNFLVVGHKEGFFRLVSVESGETIQYLSIGNHPISSVAFSPKGEWCAIGAGGGHLLVWEWQSESYIMKQQGHLDAIQSLDFSTDGRWIVTGAQDGKVKLWEVKNAFSFHTFTDHTSIVTGVAFMQNNKAVVSSSLDGTVRAFDTTRYRNFRVFTTPRPSQFCGVTVDSSTTYVASGSIDDFNVFVWHVASGRLLLEIPGHEGPISSISFNPRRGSSMLATVSWDRTLRIRDSIETESGTQVIPLEAEGTSLAFRPDGNEIVVATLDGCLTYFDPDEQKMLGSMSGRYHMIHRRTGNDGRQLKGNLEDTSFSAITYSADGTWLLAGGKSVNLCIYSASQQVLVHKQKITQNKSLAGNDFTWTAKRKNEHGLIDLLEERGKEGEDPKLPGAGASTKTPEIRVYATKFSPTGMMWAAATTEGVLMYSADPATVFTPISLDRQITPQTIGVALEKGEYDAALVMALRLNIPATITMVLENIPLSYQSAIANTMPLSFVRLCLQHLAAILGDTHHAEFHLRFIKQLMECNMQLLVEDRESFKPVLSAVEKALNGRLKDAEELIQQNKYMLQVNNLCYMDTNLRTDQETFTEEQLSHFDL